MPPLLRWLFLLLLASAVPRVERCGECRSKDGAVRLCEPHAQAERRVLEVHAEAVLGEDGAAALDALEKLAAANTEHENAPSPALTRAIARGLANDACNSSQAGRSG